MTEVDNVTAAYDAVYAGLTTSPTLRRIWRDTVLGDDYPRGFDAACYMLHPPAATIASHKDCGAACLARGVPLATATDQGVLYFPADGNEPLKTLLNSRVQFRVRSCTSTSRWN
jgi:hypothetical protein